MISGALGSVTRLRRDGLKRVPLVLLIQYAYLNDELIYKGQIMMGAFAASAVALFTNLPQPLMLVCMAVAMSTGGIWAFIPAIFKAKMGTNETIFTLMLNYIAIKFVTYLQYGPWKDPNSQGFPKVADFPQNAVLPSVGGVHIGWIIALVLVVLVYL